MVTKKFLGWGILSAVCCLAHVGWVAADTANTQTNQTTTANDKTGTNTSPTYGSGTTPAPQNTSGEPKTVPSGKRHRTHRKSGQQASSADANKTINSSDVTPSK